MKHPKTSFLISSLILLFCNFSNGQTHSGNPVEAQGNKRNAVVVWTVPAFPTKLDNVTIYFDASQGNAALAGYQGDVYAHTGVITDASANMNDWRHVIGNWGAADSRVLMTRVSPDLYSISYNIASFYGVPAQEQVLNLVFVFRNVSGSIVGRDTDGSDLFTDVAPLNGGLLLTLRSPSKDDVLLYSGDSLAIDVVVSDSASLKIYDDSILIYSQTTDHAIFFYQPTSIGQHVLKFEAQTDTTVMLQKEYLVINNNPVKIDPPSGSLYGLNYNSDSTYLFQINAPLKDFVFLLCPANDFKLNIEYQMHEAEDNSTFWIELPRTNFAGGRTTYQYFMNDAPRVADPHSEVVLDPSNDGGISPAVMATLPPYPTGMTTGIVTAFDETYHPFDFTVDDFQKPEKTKLVIYELLIRDLLTSHNYKTLTDTLDYFKNLGVTAIELMPVSEFEGNNSWGYNQSFHMALDKYYGTRDQLKTFIDEAHQRGIAVIMDVVFNHSFSQGPLVQMYWDVNNQRPSAESPYLNAIPRHPFNVGYDFNHESPYTKTWVKRILTYWLNEFKFDGFRFDLSKGLTQFNSDNDATLMAHYDASRIAILKDYAHAIWDADPNAYVILEHFADNDEEIELSNNGMMLWGNINYQFSQAAKGIKSDLEGIDYTFRGWANPNLVGYMESHDEERVMYRVLNEGDSNADYNTKDLSTAIKRIAAASTIFYTIPGPRMIWEFGELAYDFPINRCVNGTISNNCRLDPKPIRWDYLQDMRRKNLHDVISSLIYLKENFPTFSSPDFKFNDANFFVKLVHLNDASMDATVIANFRIINSDVIPDFQHTGTWYEYFTGDSIEVTDTQKRITFGPGEYRVYTSQRIVPPGGFFTGIRDISFQQIALYPNLVGDDPAVYGSLPEQSKIEQITLADMAGKILKTSYDQNDGDFLIHLPEGLTYGMYIIQIQTKDAHFTGKFVKE
ncbi:MAG: alpha-amylase family glycosyl hydrolase [Saprospiraceae bacterium]